MKQSHFGENLRRLRIKNNLSMDEFCDDFNTKFDSGLNKSTVSRYERSLQEPMMSTACNIAKYFNVDVLELLYEPQGGAPKTKGVRIPVLGKVAAGVPIEAIEDVIDYEEIPESMSRSADYFGLQIRGDSMEPQLEENDVIIVRQQETAESGEIVVALINGNDATVKRLKRSTDGIMLIPNNPQYEPLYFSNSEIERLPVRIIGKAVEVRRKL